MQLTLLQELARLIMAVASIGGLISIILGIYKITRWSHSRQYVNRTLQKESTGAYFLSGFAFFGIGLVVLSISLVALLK